MARRPLPPEQRLAHTNVSFNTAQREALYALADAEGLKVADIVRRAVVQYLARQRESAA